MNIQVRAWQLEDLAEAVAIWNEVVADGEAFPQTEPLTEETGRLFFEEQTYIGIAEDKNTQEIFGLYILHPNNIGRCGHIANASYAVTAAARGRKIGELLVQDSLRQAKNFGFRIMQFNAVVANNERALRLYRKLGFTPLGTIPGGFFGKDGVYHDIIVHYRELEDIGGQEEI